MRNEQSRMKPPAEVLYQEELEALKVNDRGTRPPGWQLSPSAVKTFIVGSRNEPLPLSGKEKGKTLTVTQKFFGDDLLVERAIITLLGNRGLMLVGEPGTAKSMLSELLTAAICGDSQLTIQGTAGTTEDQIKYSWNYALLLSEGPSPRAMVPGPIYTALKSGRIVRFEEITRCQPEIQDTLVSIVSDKCLHIPEFNGEDSVLFAKQGFNVLATANLRDRGVNEMSSALKRRFNFETVNPIRDKNLEMEIVRQQTRQLLGDSDVEVSYPDDTLELLITTFQDLRNGRTEEGAAIEKPGTIMSTAEAVAVSFSAGLDAYYFGDGHISGSHITRQLKGTVFKDDPNDVAKLKHYLDVIAKVRANKGGAWKSFYESRDVLSDS
jgi:MoxR-like ATPase